MLLLKNSRGRPDFLMTAALASLGAVLLKFLAAGVEVGSFKGGGYPDAATIGAILVPTFIAYTTKRVAVKSEHHQ